MTRKYYPRTTTLDSSASKHGLVGLTKIMAGYYDDKGVYGITLLLGGMDDTNIAGSRTPRSESPDLHNIRQVSLEASESHEYLLLNDEEWLESALDCINAREWILEKRKVVKKVYLIIGYPTYLNAKVSNETNP
jgi:hypothetical protein